MAGHSFNEGAVSPLLSAWLRPLLIAGALLLSSCSHHDSLPPFTSSGYADNQGAVRIWRKDADSDTHLLVAFSPWRGDNTTVSEYRWKDDALTLIDVNVYGKAAKKVGIRFDARGELSFMQHEADGQKQQLSTDQVALYRVQAQQIRQTSDALRQGHIALYQGRWRANHTILTCEGETVKPALEARDLAFIERRQNRATADVSVAWLEAPEGVQLLMVANEDFCRWQPTKKTF